MTNKHRKTHPETNLRLDIVLKADSVGSLEAVTTALSHLTLHGVKINLIHRGVGDISKSDVLLSETASRLIVGFQVDVLSPLNKVLREHRVEVRLYDVIYTLVADIKAIAEGMVSPPPQERIIGSARVIALFKSSRKGIIVGCEVQDGFLARGERFRIISAMGPVYSGTMESLHIGESAVQKATHGEQVGIKMRDFRKVAIGDLIESFRAVPQEKALIWEPRGDIIRK